MAKCPAHDDQRASLSVRVGDSGRVLVHCHAGCKVTDVLAAIGLSLADLTPAIETSPNGNGKASSIVAAYDYRDEQGRLLYQVVRFDPKDFRQRVPKEGGGWTWKLGSVQRVPYRLPELLAADASEAVFVPEGEKDCDRLAGLGLVTTTNAGGAGKWRSEYSEFLRGRDVVLLADNDETGEKHVQHVAESLHGMAKIVKVLRLPNLPAKGDASDWLNAGGTCAELLRLAGDAPSWTPKNSVVSGIVSPVTDAKRRDTLMPWRPFPLDALPHPICTYIKESACAIGCDPSFVALPLLACSAAAIGNTRRIRLKAGWDEPCVLWTAIVGDSGTHKTPALSAATHRLQKRQQEALARHEEALEQYQRDKLAYDADLADWKKKKPGARGEPPEAPKEPIAPRWIVSDVTLEALAERLLHAPRGLLVERDELAGWITSFDQYKGGKGGDCSQWLTLYNAKPLIVDRKAGPRKTTSVPIASVSITGGFQPETLRRALGREHWENGLAARLLLAMPPKTPRRWSEVSVSESTQSELDRVFEALFNLAFGGDGTGSPIPVCLPLMPAAKRLWQEFYNRHGGELAGMTGNEAALWSKLEGTAPRLALILHLVRVAAGDISAGDAVDEMSLAAAVILADWFGYEGRRVYAVLAESDEQGERRKLTEIIRAKGGKITERDLTRTSRKYQPADVANFALEGLVRDGWGHWEDLPTTAAGGRPTRCFVLTLGVDVANTPMIPAVDQGFGSVTGDSDPQDDPPVGADEVEI